MNLNIPPSPSSDEDDDQNQYPFSCQVFYDHRRHVYFDQEDNCSCNGVSPVETGLKLSLWNDPKPLLQMEKQPNFKVIKNSGAMKLKHSSSFEAHDLSTNTNTCCNVNIRVCSDCNTTKTPLWRSGPNGPKSLCNACGIRQRKARRAMAAAAAGSEAPETKIKQKLNKTGHATKFKKRSKATATNSAGSSSQEPKKHDLEDFLINLSKSLVFQRIFPQDEKDAAILLMAISSGLVHG